MLMIPGIGRFATYMGVNAMARCALSALFTLCLLLPGLSPAGDTGKDKRGFIDCVFTDATGKEAKYVLFVPHDYKGDKDYPLILFLHGKGQTGDDGKKQATGGIAQAMKKNEKSFPFIVIFPQSQKGSWQATGQDAQRALAILAEVQKKYKVDARRIALTGLSMGGFGTWSLAAAHPDKWCAIVPICGGGNPKSAAKIKDLPCWCFHGDADDVVPVKGSRDMIDALKKAGGNPKYDEYPGVKHNSWTKAYATKELYDWLLAQKRK